MDFEATAKNHHDGHTYRALVRLEENFYARSRYWQLALFRLPATVKSSPPLYLFYVDTAPSPMSTAPSRFSAESIKNFAQDLMQHGNLDRLANGQLMEGSPSTPRAGGPEKGGILDKYNLINIARNAVQYEEFSNIPALFLAQMVAKAV